MNSIPKRLGLRRKRPRVTGPDALIRLKTALAKTSAPSSDFDLNGPMTLPEGRKLRPASVLVPLIETGTGLSLILTKRSAALKHHPGQIAFPGGKQDESDLDQIDTALREAEEEIGLDRAGVNILGSLPSHETVTGFTVSPVVAIVAPGFVARPELGEVEEVFEVPFAHLARPDSFQIQSRIWRGQRRYFYTAPYGPYYIWGATARILRGLAERLAT
jgi:8-oxo-dGTP pyrophosphatase MutT (NUDIX family)